jgi:pellino protein
MMDALTTNGVLLLRPQGGFEPSSEPGLWKEVSVAGDLYRLRKSRSDRERGNPVRIYNWLKVTYNISC